MVVGVEGHAGLVAARDPARLLKTLLVTAVAVVAQRPPIVLIPEQTARFFDSRRVFAFDRLTQSMRDVVVNHGGGDDHAEALVIDAERMLCEKTIARYLPSVTIPTLR